MAANEPVYASIDDVRVPANVAPGAKFSARTYGRRQGQRVPVAKHFWRASGNVPVIVPAIAAVSSGPRHAHRPSAVARRSAGVAGARAIDNIQTTVCAVSQWQSAVELPIEQHEHDVGWQPGPVNGGRSMPAFTGAQTGARDTALTSRSTAARIMKSAQFS